MMMTEYVPRTSNAAAASSVDTVAPELVESMAGPTGGSNGQVGTGQEEPGGRGTIPSSQGTSSDTDG